jgi:hypothetical protein
MIQRRKDYVKREPSRDAHKIYLVCEGKGTEPYYFKFFEGLSSNLQVITIPPADGSDPIKLMELAKKDLIGPGRKYTVECEHGDTVWFIIDTDTWEEEGKIKPLREFCLVQNSSIKDQMDEVKPYSVWNVAQSNPCFEIWLYYHFYDHKPDKEAVDGCASFKEYVNKMIAGGFNFEKDPVRLEAAITNTEANFQLDKDGNLNVYSTEMYIPGREILGFVKTELDKLRNKL